MTLPLTATTYPIVDNDPDKILDFAHRAAKALTSVINSKPKQVVINNEQYLTFEDWQTIARFYGTTVGIEWTKSVSKDDHAFGYEAKAVAYRDGITISSAEASCSREEFSWSEKPAFQIKSMAQTRAMAKCLRNIFAWVVVLAGYKPTPAEEMESTVVPTNTYDSSNRYRGWENRPENDHLTDKQRTLLADLITQKTIDEEDREEMLNKMESLFKAEASEMISNLLRQ